MKFPWLLSGGGMIGNRIVDRGVRKCTWSLCTGVASGARVDKLAEAVWDANFDTNTKGTFLMCQAVAPIMQRQTSGRILNAASFAAIIPSIGSAAYAASKSAVVQFTRVLAGELGPFNVTVNSYSPGMIPTEMNGFAPGSAAR